jgi:hypothetical protein
VIYLWGGLLLLLIGVVCAIGLVPLMVHGSRGTRPITAEELLAINDPQSLPSPWVTCTPDRPIVETSLGIETKMGTGSSKTRFVLVPVKDKWMVAQRELDAHGNRLEGELGKWEIGLGPKAMEKIKAQHLDKKDKLLPFALTETSGGPVGRLLFFAIGSAAVILFGLGCAIYGFATLPRPRRR